ncbi:MAG: hypothetical protein ACI4BB_00540 [Coprococcus sp.]
MRFIWKKLKVFLLIICFAYVLTIPVYAHEIPDESRTGTITLTLQYDGEPVVGGTLIIYRVGEIYEENGNYGFVPVDDFLGFEGTLDDVQSATLAQELVYYAVEHSVKGTEIINMNGEVVFDNLEPGLYLVVQGEAAPGYSPISPFLVSVPLWEDDIYNYIVNATPKIELEKETEPDIPSIPSEPKLPQTGQLNWPVPVLAAAGMALFIIGWGLRYGRRQDRHAE